MQPLSCFRRGFIALGLALGCVFASTDVPGRADAQEGQGKYIAQATVRLTKLIDAGNKDGYALKDNAFSIGGGWLKPSQSTWVPIYTVMLQEGKKYRVVAAGDNDAKDVDVDIMHVESNKLVAQDVDTAATAQVDFSPSVTGRYVIRLRLYDSANNVPCMCMAVVMSKE